MATQEFENKLNELVASLVALDREISTTPDLLENKNSRSSKIRELHKNNLSKISLKLLEIDAILREDKWLDEDEDKWLDEDEDVDTDEEDYPTASEAGRATEN